MADSSSYLRVAAPKGDSPPHLEDVMARFGQVGLGFLKHKALPLDALKAEGSNVSTASTCLNSRADHLASSASTASCISWTEAPSPWSSPASGGVGGGALPRALAQLQGLTDSLWEDSSSEDNGWAFEVPMHREGQRAPPPLTRSIGAPPGLTLQAPIEQEEEEKAAEEAAEVADDWDCDSEASVESEPGMSTAVLVGPTDLAVQPFKLANAWLPERRTGNCGAVPVRSRPNVMVFSDARRLADARSKEAPLSFGSTLHLTGGHTSGKSQCRPCMFERWPGRCSKGWLCDFCHMHPKAAKRPDEASKAKEQGRI